jgi:predicted PurR-regulated permease PerM
MTRRRTSAATDQPAAEQTTAPAATLPPDRERTDRGGRPDLWRDAWGRAAARSAQTLLVLALVVVVVWAAVQLRLLVVPLLLAILIAAAASPLVGLLSRYVPRALAVWIALLTAFALLGGVGYLVGSAVRSQWSELVTGASEGLDELQRFLTEGPLGLDQEQIDSARGQIGELASGAQVQAGAITGATLVVEVLAGLFLGLVLLFFLLKDGASIWRFARSFLPDRHGDRYDVVADRAVEVLGGYVRGTAIIALVDAVVIGVALLVLGVPLALPLAVIVFVGAFVPLVGATVAGALAALIALVGNGPLTALIVVGVVIAVNQLEGDLLAPVVLGRSLSLHPLAVLLALTAGTIVAGIIGAILAVPFAAVAWAVVDTWRSPHPSADDGRSTKKPRAKGRRGS